MYCLITINAFTVVELAVDPNSVNSTQQNAAPGSSLLVPPEGLL